MPAKKKSARKKAARKSAGRRAKKTSSARSGAAPRRAPRRSREPDALELLREDHERVQRLFDRFESARGDDRKQKLAEQICLELQVHASIEEDLFYPAVREATGEEELLNEAEVEHQAAKDLIARIQAMSAGDEKLGATVTVLGEYVRHHIDEEQDEIFPKARKAKLDLSELGGRLRDRKEQLTSGSPLGKLRRMLM